MPRARSSAEAVRRPAKAIAGQRPAGLRERERWGAANRVARDASRLPADHWAGADDANDVPVRPVGGAAA
jgi:hypothetical protein